MLAQNRRNRGPVNSEFGSDHIDGFAGLICSDHRERIVADEAFLLSSCGSLRNKGCSLARRIRVEQFPGSNDLCARVRECHPGVHRSLSHSHAFVGKTLGRRNESGAQPITSVGTPTMQLKSAPGTSLSRFRQVMNRPPLNENTKSLRVSSCHPPRHAGCRRPGLPSRARPGVSGQSRSVGSID